MEFATDLGHTSSLAFVWLVYHLPYLAYNLCFEALALLWQQFAFRLSVFGSMWLVLASLGGVYHSWRIADACFHV